MNESVITFKFSPDESKLAVITEKKTGSFGSFSEGFICTLQVYDVETRDLIWADTTEISIIDQTKEVGFGGSELVSREVKGHAFSDIAFDESGERLTVLCRKPKALDDDCSNRIEEDEKDAGNLFFAAIRSASTGELIRKLDLETDKNESWSEFSHLVNGNSVLGKLTNYSADSCGKYLGEIALFKLDGKQAERKTISTQSSITFDSNPSAIFLISETQVEVLDLEGKLTETLSIESKIEDSWVEKKSGGLLAIYASQKILPNLYVTPSKPTAQLKRIEHVLEKSNSQSHILASHLAKGIVLASVGFNTPSGLPTGVRVLDNETANPLFEYYHNGYVRNATFSPKGTFIASSSAENTVRFRKMNGLPVKSNLIEKKEKLRTKLKEDERFAYKKIGKTLVSWSDDLGWEIENTFSEEQATKIDSLFPDVENYLLVGGSLLEMEGRIPFEGWLGGGALFKQIYFSEMEKKIYAVDRNIITSIDIKILNQIATLYNQKPNEKWVKKQIWNSWSKARQTKFNQSFFEKN